MAGFSLFIAQTAGTELKLFSLAIRLLRMNLKRLELQNWEGKQLKP